MMMTRFVLTLLVGLGVSLGALVSGVEPVLAKNWNTGKKEINLDAFTEFRTGLIETQGQSHSVLAAFNQGKSFSGFWARGIVFFDGKLCSWSSEITNTNLMTGSLTARCPDNWSFKGTYANLGNSRGAQGDGLDNSGKHVNFKFDGRGSSSLKKAKSYYINTFPNPYGLSAESRSATARANANGGVISRGTLANLDRTTLCLSAVNPYTKTWSEAANYRMYVQEAKSRGLTCGVGEPTQTAPTSSSNSSNQATKIATNRKLADKHRVDSGRIVPLETYWPHEIECKLDAGSGLPNRLLFNKDAVNLGVDTGLVGLVLPLQTTLTSDTWQALLDERGKAVLIVEYSNSNVKKANYKCNKTSSEVIELASQYPVLTEAEIAERERKEKEKAEAEAQKLAEAEAKRLAEEKKKEEEARKAAELAAKKKEEEAILKFKVEKQKAEAADLYSAVIEYVKSSADVDIVLWSDRYNNAPQIDQAWNQKMSDAYGEFRGWAFSNIKFEEFFMIRADVRKREFLKNFDILISKLAEQETELREIIKSKFGMPEASGAVNSAHAISTDAIELFEKIGKVLAEKSDPQKFELLDLSNLSLSTEKFIENHRASEANKKRTLEEIQKMRLKIQEFSKNNFGSSGSRAAIEFLREIDTVFSSNSVDQKELNRLEVKAQKFMEEVVNHKKKESSKAGVASDDSSMRNQDVSPIKFDVYQNYALWEGMTDSQKDEFKEKWVDQYVEVTGPISDVDKMVFQDDAHWVILDTGLVNELQGNGMFIVRAMTDLTKTEARKLKIGQKITLRGNIKRILLGSLTLEDAVIMSKSSNDLSSGKLTFSSRWLCDVPMLAFGGVIGRMNAEFSFNGDNVFVTFTNPYTGEVLDSGSARGNYSGNVFQLPTSGSTIYEVNRSNGLLQVKSNGTVIEASSCMSRN